MVDKPKVSGLIEMVKYAFIMKDIHKKNTSLKKNMFLYNSLIELLNTHLKYSTGN